MSGCSCIYGTEGDWEGCLFYGGRHARALADQPCCECGETIPAGHLHDLGWIKFKDPEYCPESEDCQGSRADQGCPHLDVDYFPVCKGCADLREHFFCAGGWSDTEALKEIIDHLDNQADLDICCLDGLSPEALGIMERHVWPLVWGGELV